MIQSLNCSCRTFYTRDKKLPRICSKVHSGVFVHLKARQNGLSVHYLSIPVIHLQSWFVGDSNINTVLFLLILLWLVSKRGKHRTNGFSQTKLKRQSSSPSRRKGANEIKTLCVLSCFLVVYFVFYPLSVFTVIHYTVFFSTVPVSRINVGSVHFCKPQIR